MNKRIDVTYPRKILPYPEFKDLLQKGHVAQIMIQGFIFHVSVSEAGYVFVVLLTQAGPKEILMAQLYELYRHDMAHLLN